MEKSYLSKKTKRKNIFKINIESNDSSNKKQKIEETKEIKEKNQDNEKDDEIMIKTEKEKKIDEEYDYIVKEIKEIIPQICNDFKEFKNDYTFYCYNNFKELKTNEVFKKLKSKDDLKNKELKDKLKQDIYDYIIKREYRIKEAEEGAPKKEQKNKIQDTNSGKTAFGDSFDDLDEDEQEELFISTLVESCLKKTRKAEEEFDTSRNKDWIKKYEIKIDVQNFNLQEKSLFALFNGIKFNNNLSVINLNGNPLTPRASFCLGNIFLYHKKIKILSLVRCCINNKCLEMLVKGATHIIKSELNKETIYIDQLNLKDNDIDEKNNEDNTYSLSLIVEKFIIKKLNLANNKIKNEGLKKISETFTNILDNKDSYFQIETLNLFNIGIQNEECLEFLGKVLSHVKCPIQNLILSRNKITTFIPDKLIKNHFAIFMDKIKENKSLKELALLKCDIGKNENDINNICDMLKKNNTLISLKLFDNLISDFNDFVTLLKIFNDENNKNDKNNENINKTLKHLDISKNHCNLRISDDFLNMLDYSTLENLDINQNIFDEQEKDIFRKRTNTLDKIKIIY